ncbi:MAG: RAMP superfamily CRISPR-associated protein [Methanothrix soehngenii]|jgi:CRISPR/Cas system CSM-associated protein Csm3 (group 7 of RAMP superfamily)|nr:RAMP superfamily CRISPR-associated protein [Methanothrix soehngenii]
MKYRVVTARLTARTAVHIGSGEGNDLTDSLMRRDSKGFPFIPGTAIAGALRSLLTRIGPRLNAGLCSVLDKEDKRRKKSCSCGVCHLFGDVNPSDEEAATSEASKLLVFNARPIGGLPLPLIRDGVGIDRMTGAAARAGAVKFDMEVLPARSAFELRMELRDSNSNDEKLLAAGLAEWEAGRLWLGGRVVRGLGAFELSNIQFKTRNLDEPKDVMSFLKDDRPWQNAREKDNWLQEKLNSIECIVPEDGMPEGVARCWLSLTGTLQADGPLLTNDTMISGASGFDHAPLLAEWGNWKKPVLSGAGLRGVLRSHAERLARTIASSEYEDKESFLHHCPACDPNARDDHNDEQLPLESCDSLLKKANYSRDKESNVCLACSLFGSTRHGSRLIVEDAPYKSTDDQTKPIFKMLDFLAIDRFTGGAADEFKFDALALWRPAFALRIFLDNPTPWELGWLWLVIRDLSEGWLNVGFGSAKGFGRAKFANWDATFGYLSTDDNPLVLRELDLPKGKSGIYTTININAATNLWREIAEDWINAFHEEIKKERHFEFDRREDNYFDHLKHLYPIIKGDAL